MTLRGVLRLAIWPLPITIGLIFLFNTAWARKDSVSHAVGVGVIVVHSEAEADKLLQSLNAGMDFSVLAREKSIDPTAIDGGFLGKVDPASLRPELRDAIQGLSPGQLSKVVTLPGGFAIVKVLLDSETARADGADRNRQFAISAEGNVRFAPDVSGLNDAETAFRQFEKPEGWEQDLATICAARTQSIAATMAQIRHYLDLGNPNNPSHDKTIKPMDLISLHMALGQLHAYKGEMKNALDQWEIAYGMAASEVPDMLSLLDETLGVGYLHKSEMDNDVYRHPGDRCLFPMRPGVRYAETSSSEKAIQHFLKYLNKKPEDLEVKWLLNLAYMTTGSYPARVPAKYLLAPSSFASTETVERFTDVAPETGLNSYAMAGGVIVDDFDNDGLFDVITSTFDNCGPLHFFHNDGNGKFTDRAAKAGLSDQLGGLNIIQADYNNDGCMDILVLRGGWEFPHRKSLLRNNCNGTFTDVTKASGLAEPATATQAAVWADINNDGFLDLFVGNERGPAQLLLNRGDGTFKDISDSAGIDHPAYGKGVAAADYDNDGYVDFYLTDYTGTNCLYHNNHDGTFTQIAKQAGVQGPGRSFNAWFFDYDNDGLPDLFVTSYYMSIEETMRTYLGLSHGVGTLKLYRNLGNGAFDDVTEQAKLDKVFMPMGGNFGDIDNDGYLDIYLGTGNPSYGSILPNVLLRNRDGKSFVDVTTSSGTGELHKGHGTAFADIDNDGDEDLLTEVGGAVPGDAHAFRLFENPGNGNDWISLRLIGVKANRSAIGARIKVTVKNGDQERFIYRTVGSGGSFGASPLQQHIGLGRGAQAISLDIWWPGGSRTPQHFSHVDKNQSLEIKEFAQDYTKLERPAYRLGGAAKKQLVARTPTNGSTGGVQH